LAIAAQGGTAPLRGANRGDLSAEARRAKAEAANPAIPDAARESGPSARVRRGAALSSSQKCGDRIHSIPPLFQKIPRNINARSKINPTDFQAGVYCPRSDTGGFRSAPNLWKVRTSAGAADVASMM
jgi:hypothetical protein